MPVNTDLVRAYNNGLVAVQSDPAVAPTLPTDASAPVGAGFGEIGALTSDGITEATSQERTDVFMWQGNALMRRIPGQYVKTFAFAAAETNLLTLGVHFPGSTVTQTATGLTIEEKPPTSEVRAWVFHGIDGVKAQRIVVPKGEVTERGEVVWSSENVTVYQWTVSCYVDANGVVAYRYYLDAALADTP